MARQVFTVTQVNRYVKRVLESDALTAGLFIEGELSNFRDHSSGHMYFTLKDASAALNGVMFKSYTESLDFTPKNGMKVVVFGHLSLYEKTGQYQFYAEYMEPAGVGSLQIAFTQLCEKLQKEGLFDDSRKQPIPLYPTCVAVITSPTGAAVQDIVRIARERNPAVRLVVVPAIVQGQDAAPDIARAIGEVNAWTEVEESAAEVIILGRGGGSMEDLWAFNEEVTARAVAASRIPIISAVGHETDFTVTDFVADMRAPTPTAAAQMAVYDWAQTMAYLRGITNDLHQAAQENILANYTHAQALLKRLNRRALERIAKEKDALAHHTALLEKVSPYAAFRRGFALVNDELGEPITTPKALTPGKNLTLYWAEGYATVKVKEITT